jgi:hypothetical protein
MPKGERHGRARLTEQQVKDIRRLRETKLLTYPELGERYGITWQYAWRICAGRAWKHVA